MSDADWERVVALLIELGASDFCVFGETDEAAELVEQLIALVVK